MRTRVYNDLFFNRENILDLIEDGVIIFEITLSNFLRFRKELFGKKLPYEYYSIYKRWKEEIGVIDVYFNIIEQ